MLDPDAPSPSYPFLGPVLHWLWTDLTSSSPSTAKPNLFPLTSTTTPLSSYLPPGPPPFTKPHRYAFLLYEQPEGFDVEKFRKEGKVPEARFARVRWDVAGFEKAGELRDVKEWGGFSCRS
jgi:phosphatidylethanolamine-binding protein